MNTAAAPRNDDCYHCGAPLAGSNYHVTIDGRDQPVCCPACQAVAATIVAGGFANYYRFREEARAQTAAAPATEQFAAFDQPDFQQRWLREGASGERECELLIGGMHCAACVWLLENQLRRLPGLSAVQVDFSEQRAFLRWSPQQLRLSEICGAVAAVGYQPQPYSRDRSEQLREREQRQALRRLGVAGIGMMQVGMCALGLYAGAIDGIEPVYRDLLRWISLLVTVPIVFYSGQSFFVGAWRGLRRGAPGMDLPIALAIALAFAASAHATVTGGGEVYFDSVTMFIFLLLGSRYLELRARHYGGRLGGDLLSLLPSAAIRLDQGRQQPVPPDRLQVGDTVLVGAGQTVPADGRLLDAEAQVNEAALTGEFMPVAKRRGELLLAGSVNGGQSLTFTVTGVGQQMQLAAIQALGRYAQVMRPRLAQLADRLASVFSLVVVGLAGATWLGWFFIEPARAFWVALSVLVVSCPCALGLATPTALTNATRRLREAGLLVTSAEVWEKLPLITDVVFDKTGTLTAGRMRVAATLPCTGRSPEVCRDIAAALEAGSSHPIAKAFEQPGIKPAEARHQVPGHGVAGRIAGRDYRLGTPAFALALCGGDAAGAARSGHWIVLADARGPLCWFRLDDEIRADASAATAALRARGLQLHLLSGDRSDAVGALGAALDIDQVEAGADPARKLDYVAQLQREGRRVLMVGDGINDVPVLAAADVSVAMSDASQWAKTNAGCILLAPRLDRLPLLLDTGARTRNIVRQNLWWALGYNALALPLAAAGWVPPWLAAVGMSLSSLLVVANALRLRRAPVAAKED